MVNIDRFIHSCLDGKKYIFNSDILKLNIDNKVIFLGFRNDANKLLNCIDIFIFPSIIGI